MHTHTHTKYNTSVHTAANCRVEMWDWGKERKNNNKPCGGKTSLRSQKPLSWSWNLRVHYSDHKSLLLVLQCKPGNAVHHSISYFFRIHFNIILPSTPRSPQSSLLFRFLDYHWVCTTHLILIYLKGHYKPLGLCLYSTFICSVWFSHKTAFIFLNSIQWEVFVMEMHCFLWC
jgi:hypothetical protein